MEDKLTTKQDLQELKSDFHATMARMELKLTVRMGAIMVAGIAIISAIVKFT